VKKSQAGVFLLALGIAVPVLAQPPSRDPNPLRRGPLRHDLPGSPGHALVYVYVGSATGTLFASGGPTGRRHGHMPPRVRSFISSTPTPATPSRLSP